MGSNEPVLIVGGGIAGQAVCEELRALDGEIPIVLACAEPYLPYDRVNLSKLLDGATVEDLQLRPGSWYEDRQIDVRLRTRVESLDLEAGTCVLGNGERLAFSRAVIATGSDALVPPIAGASGPGVHVFRDPADCAAMLDEAASATGAVVIGGGLLGLEAARGLSAQGCPTTVVHLMDRVMERQLDQGAADLLRTAMEQLGVAIELERSTVEVIKRRGRAAGLMFSDGRQMDCDMVVISVGIKPQVALAQQSGLLVERGVVVDDRLVTSHERVLAVGECAQHRDVVYGIVAPILEQAKVAAATLTGGEIEYVGSTMSTKLKVAGVDLVSVGVAEGERAVVIADGGAGTYRKLVATDGRATGAVLLGDTRGHELLLDAVKSGREVDDLLGLLVEAGQATAAELPESAQICNCNGVCKGEIVAAIRDGGLGSTQEVVSTTRAGAGCGSCKPMIKELLEVELGGVVEEATYLCPCRRQTREELAAVVREHGVESVSELSQTCGAGRDCGACKPGLAYLVSEICGNRHREERHARFINDRVHANIQNDGTFSVVPRMRGGVTTPAELRRIAEVAERYDVPLVKVTGGQRIDLLGISKENLPAVWEELDMPSGHAYAKAVRTVKTCVGTDFCRFGLGDAMDVGIELETLMEGLHTPAKVKSAVSGCPRNCAESYVKDIGLVAVEGGWEIYIGGAAGGTVRKGDLLATVTTREEATRLALVFLQHYRENGDYLERTYGYCERVGLEAIREACLDEENAGELLERYRIAKAAADPDPWLERHDPVHPKQFAELDSSPALLPIYQSGKLA